MRQQRASAERVADTIPEEATAEQEDEIRRLLNRYDFPLAKLCLESVKERLKQDRSPGRSRDRP
ncbi:MAG: hypothetical protein JWN86_1686 [Planctomycetota bacterium]|nr:hypothetical protein [Planctomycetota bacterium]